ncbi:leucine-rich repeat-containing protein 74A-like isoform X1 [Haliotis rufescens]|uniref:leucine-rich repeat-containing protein 74A-like isoform X1 n=1 Tax=Haliotis rufescens TaxID=6454 RepID=UPI00201F95CF|nr:leucine-rich repeat-containing protein 74A-like isoform X1 [Haliotis rufescens]
METGYEDPRVPPLDISDDVGEEFYQSDEGEGQLKILSTIPDIRKEAGIFISPDGHKKSAKVRKKSSRVHLRSPDLTQDPDGMTNNQTEFPLIEGKNVTKRPNVGGASDPDVGFCGMGDPKKGKVVDQEEPSDDVYISVPSTAGHTSVNEDDGYDTDLGDKDEFRHKELEQQLLICRENTDIGHLSYEEACKTHGATPLRRVVSQLWLTKMQLQHVGLNVKQVKAICAGLVENTKVEDLDLEGNGMDGAGIALISDLLKKNTFISRVSLKANTLENKGSVALSDLLQLTTTITQLNLHSCQIGDHEILHLATGIQNNESMNWLSLSHNKIGILGGIQLGRALGVNNYLEYVDVSWNQIRTSGAVSVCKSLQKNHTIRKLDVSWNGFGFEGSLAIGESLKMNRTLKVLDMANNRINWDCVPYIGRGIRANRCLEVLDLGHNPLSMEGCDELLDAIAKPTCCLRHLGLENIPINSKVAFSATEISRTRKFTLHHGGILSTHDIIGIQRDLKEVKRQDPMSLLTRYLGTIGIRVVDLFRMFDTENRFYVSKEKFIRGLKRVRAPLDEEEMQAVVKRIGMSKGGQINYQLLAAGVRKHIRDERKEDMRQEALERKRREDRRRILQSDAIISAPESGYYFPSMYNIYGTRFIGRPTEGTSSLSRQNSFANVTTPGSFLPKIFSESPRSLIAVSETESLRQTPAETMRINKKKRTRSKSVTSQKSTKSEMSGSSGGGYLPPLSSLNLRHDSP